MDSDRTTTSQSGHPDTAPDRLLASVRGSLTPPDIVAHADWSVSPSKRWVAIACREGRGYVMQAPRRVAHAHNLLRDLCEMVPNGRVLIGFDFPIGLPLAFAQRAGITRFLDALSLFGAGEWSHFYERASRPEQISLRRPFYPATPGGTRQEHLWQALGLASMNELRRRCELPAQPRRAASPLFWTLGAQQVGAAAITGWREVLVPAMRDPAVSAAIWPFAGELHDLLTRPGCVIAETYPADAYVRLGLPCFVKRWSKRRQTDRRSCAPVLSDRARAISVRFSKELEQELTDGFGSAAEGEDPFDAVVGLLAMLQVVTGTVNESTPRDANVREIEGWILGQPSEPHHQQNSCTCIAKLSATNSR